MRIIISILKLYLFAFLLLLLSSASASASTTDHRSSTNTASRVDEYYGTEASIPIHKTAVYKELYTEYVELRTREIRRRLSVNHGYDPKELAVMIHKPELVHALSREVYKEREKKKSDMNRKRLWHMGGTVVIASLIYFLSPVWMQAYDIISVNYVVYTDRKCHEASRCLEIGSFLGCIGFILLFILEMLSFWLSASVLLSWFVTRNKYFFPVPSIPLRPGALLNSAKGISPANRQGLSEYSFNCGPMAISWALGFLNRKVQAWMGRCLAKAQRRQQKTERKAERKAERKQAKKSQRSAEDRAARKAEKATKKAVKKDAAAGVTSGDHMNNNNTAEVSSAFEGEGRASRDDGCERDSFFPGIYEKRQPSGNDAQSTEYNVFDELD